MSTLFKEKQAAAAAKTGSIEPEHVRQLSPTEREWKQRIYERLLKVLDLSLLSSLGEEEARNQIREVTDRLLLEESAPLSLAQRQFVTRRIEDEVMGLGPLEPLLAIRPSPTSWSTAPARSTSSVRQARADRGAVQRRRAPDAHHRPHRVGGRPPRGRVLADGGRAPQGRLARQRDHPAAGARWPDAVDPAFRRRAALDRRPDPPRHDRRTAVARAQRHRAWAPERRGLRRYRLRQDDPAEHPLGVRAGTERIVTIEDSAELQLQQPHVVRLETRPPNIEGKGASRSATWCATPCACGRTASSSARCAAARRWTCCRR